MSPADSCKLCGRSVDSRGDDGPFCSEGCRRVHRTLEDGKPRGADGPGRRRAADRGADADGAGPDGTTGTFFRIDGMHRPTCEAYLEAVATGRDGVVDAEASYVTETIRVEHDPDRIAASELRDALTTTGYTAYVRSEAAGEDDGTGPTRRAREMTGVRKRRTEDMLDARFIAGIVFGAFLLVPYVAVLYPVHIADLYDGGFLGLYADAVGGDATLLYLRTFAVLTGIVLYFTGMPVLRGAYIAVKMRRANADLLVALAVVSAFVYSTAAAALGRIDIYYDLVIVIAAGVMAASFYESTVKRRGLDLLTELTISQVDDARRLDDEGTTEVAVDDLEPGDRVLVRDGERIPVDGVVAEGECTVDEAVVTGESLPVRKRAGEAVVGGSVVVDDAVVVRVGDAATSSIDRLTRSVWDLQSGAHGMQRRADRVAGRAGVAVAAVAVLVGAGRLALGADPAGASLSALLAVVVVSPWALGLATPLSVASTLEEAIDRGVVVFDETVFERLEDVDVVVFDKTGTLTTGRMEVLEADAPGDLLARVAALERRSSHPAAAAIVDAFAPGEGDAADASTDGGDRDGSERPDGGRVVEPSVRDVRTHATGIYGVVDGDEVLVGLPDLFSDRGWSVPEGIERRVERTREAGRLPVVVGENGAATGTVVVGDEPRPGWDEVVAELSERGVEVVVLTGDHEAAAEPFAEHPGVDHLFAGVPPEGKTATVRRLRARGRVAMVGDGTNDAPALAAADLGIALGGGTALASDAADVAVVGDDLGAVETAFELAAGARRRLERNVALALSYNAVAVPAALAGVLSPPIAVLAAAVAGGLVVANSSRPIVED